MLLNKLKKAVELLQPAVRSLQRKSELEVTTQSKGLMSVNTFNEHNQIWSQAQWKPNGTDMFSLVPGFYRIYNPQSTKIGNLQGNPGWWFISVVKNGTNDWVYRAISTYWGTEYRYVDYHDTSNYGTPKAWAAVETSSILWSGSTTKAGTIITLADKVSKYRKLRIYIRVSKTYYMLEVSSNDTSTHQYVPTEFSINFQNLTSNPKRNMEYQYKLDFTRPSQTQIKINAAKVILFDIDKMTASVQADTGYEITRIEGVN